MYIIYSIALIQRSWVKILEWNSLKQEHKWTFMKLGNALIIIHIVEIHRPLHWLSFPVHVFLHTFLIWSTQWIFKCIVYSTAHELKFKNEIHSNKNTNDIHEIRKCQRFVIVYLHFLFVFFFLLFLIWSAQCVKPERVLRKVNKKEDERPLGCGTQSSHKIFRDSSVSGLQKSLLETHIHVSGPPFVW